MHTACCFVGLFVGLGVVECISFVCLLVWALSNAYRWFVGLLVRWFGRCRMHTVRWFVVECMPRWFVGLFVGLGVVECMPFVGLLVWALSNACQRACQRACRMHEC